MHYNFGNLNFPSAHHLWNLLSCCYLLTMPWFAHLPTYHVGVCCAHELCVWAYMGLCKPGPPLPSSRSPNAVIPSVTGPLATCSTGWHPHRKHESVFLVCTADNRDAVLWSECQGQLQRGRDISEACWWHSEKGKIMIPGKYLMWNPLFALWCFGWECFT